MEIVSLESTLRTTEWRSRVKYNGKNADAVIKSLLNKQKEKEMTKTKLGQSLRMIPAHKMNIALIEMEKAGIVSARLERAKRKDKRPTLIIKLIA